MRFPRLKFFKFLDYYSYAKFSLRISSYLFFIFLIFVPLFISNAELSPRWIFLLFILFYFKFQCISCQKCDLFCVFSWCPYVTCDLDVVFPVVLCFLRTFFTRRNFPNCVAYFLSPVLAKILCAKKNSLFCFDYLNFIIFQFDLVTFTFSEKLNHFFHQMLTFLTKKPKFLRQDFLKLSAKTKAGVRRN